MGGLLYEFESFMSDILAAPSSKSSWSINKLDGIIINRNIPTNLDLTSG